MNTPTLRTDRLILRKFGAFAIPKSVDFTAFAVNVKTIAPIFMISRDGLYRAFYQLMDAFSISEIHTFPISGKELPILFGEFARLFF